MPPGQVSTAQGDIRVSDASGTAGKHEGVKRSDWAFIFKTNTRRKFDRP